MYIFGVCPSKAEKQVEFSESGKEFVLPVKVIDHQMTFLKVSKVEFIVRNFLKSKLLPKITEESLMKRFLSLKIVGAEGKSRDVTGSKRGVWGENCKVLPHGTPESLK